VSIKEETKGTSKEGDKNFYVIYVVYHAYTFPRKENAELKVICSF
jgi:hypothetical protein